MTLLKRLSCVTKLLDLLVPGLPAGQLLGYRKYIQQLSPLSTQQGIKGTEFDRVLVVLDDEENTHVQFSYDKYFGVKPLSKNDI